MKQPNRSLISLLGRNVRAARLKQEMTQELLGEKAGLHPTYIGGVERGERNPTVSVVEKLAKGLRVTAAELFRRPRA